MSVLTLSVARVCVRACVCVRARVCVCVCACGAGGLVEDGDSSSEINVSGIRTARLDVVLLEGEWTLT